jgi:hypothetical protein
MTTQMEFYALVPTDLVKRRMTRQLDHKPDDAECVMELAALVVHDELKHWSHDALAKRWKAGKGRVRRLAQLLADRVRTMTGPTSDHHRTRLAESFPHVAATFGPGPDQDRTRTGPSRARPSSRRSEKEKEKDLSVQQERDLLLVIWGHLEAVRQEHHAQVYNKTPRARPLTQKRRANLQARVRDLQEAGLEPETALLKAADWVYTSTAWNACGARKTGDPIETLLRPSHCVSYCEKALDNVQAQPDPGRGGNTTSIRDAVRQNPDLLKPTTGGLMDMFNHPVKE